MYWNKDNVVGVTNEKAVGILYIDDRGFRYDKDKDTYENIYNINKILGRKDENFGGLEEIKMVYESMRKATREEMIEIIEEKSARLQEEINENCKLKTELYGNSVSKDKIKEKLEELDTSDDLDRYARLILKELLEE